MKAPLVRYYRTQRETTLQEEADNIAKECPGYSTMPTELTALIGDFCGSASMAWADGKYERFHCKLSPDCARTMIFEELGIGTIDVTLEPRAVNVFEIDVTMTSPDSCRVQFWTGGIWQAVWSVSRFSGGSSLENNKLKLTFDLTNASTGSNLRPMLRADYLCPDSGRPYTSSWYPMLLPSDPTGSDPFQIEVHARGAKIALTRVTYE